MKELKIDATLDNLDNVLAFIEEALDEIGVPMKIMTQMNIVAEEIYVNIAHYAYNPHIGEALIKIDEDGENIYVTFEDGGVPYNPLEKEDPDITKSAEERDIGGLGIFMVKNMMDDIAYNYENNKNILTIKKTI